MFYELELAKLERDLLGIEIENGRREPFDKDFMNAQERVMAIELKMKKYVLRRQRAAAVQLVGFVILWLLFLAALVRHFL